MWTYVLWCNQIYLLNRCWILMTVFLTITWNQNLITKVATGYCSFFYLIRCSSNIIIVNIAWNIFMKIHQSLCNADIYEIFLIQSGFSSSFLRLQKKQRLSPCKWCWNPYWHTTQQASNNITFFCPRRPLPKTIIHPRLTMPVKMGMETLWSQQYRTLKSLTRQSKLNIFSFLRWIFVLNC